MRSRHHPARWWSVRPWAGTHAVEGFFSQLKRSIDGTHHGVSVEHLAMYLGEFDYRYSTRAMNDGERMRKLIDQTARRRLSYRPLTTPV